MASIHERYAPRGVQVVGVHTPEFDQERERALVEANVRTLDVHYPVVLDNDSAMWDALLSTLPKFVLRLSDKPVE